MQFLGCWTDGYNHFSQPPSYSLANLVFCWCQSSLLTHVQLIVHLDPQVIFYRAAPDCAFAKGSLITDEGLGICLCWVSWDSYQPIFAACKGLSEWLPCLPASYTLLNIQEWGGCSVPLCQRWEEWVKCRKLARRTVNHSIDLAAGNNSWWARVNSIPVIL